MGVFLFYIFAMLAFILAAAILEKIALFFGGGKNGDFVDRAFSDSTII